MKVRRAPEHDRQVAILIGTQPPVTDVFHDPDPNLSATDSGFSVLLADAPDDPEDLADNDPRLATICLHCLIERHPEAGLGLDLAAQHGSAERDVDTGEWST